MIVREMPNDRLLCIHQTTHGLMAEEFCRQWGNRDFARPAPYSAVMMGISQHDNGWYEWDKRPKLDDGGYPLDFMLGPEGDEKIALWQRGVDRVYTQHPYAALLVGRHATWLYLEDASRRARAFVERQDKLLATVRRELAGDEALCNALRNEGVESNSRLLQFGDSASLQVTVPWGDKRTFQQCPLDGQGETVAVEMVVEEDVIGFSPWPFGVDEFEVSIHGRLLTKRTFAHDTEYQAALHEAPIFCQRWTVVRDL